MLRRGTAAPVLALALLCAPAALADSSTSTNWSGYVAHRTGVAFHRVSAVWKLPRPSCGGSQRPGYSSTWVGLGGYGPMSQSTEQVGTELDCTAAGRVVSSAWYEVLPAAAKKIRMTVHPGDQISATVSVSGRVVHLRLTDRTRRRTLSKRIRAAAVDVTSAEWIVEAPTWCDSAGDCAVAPLTDFGSIQITGARAQTAAGTWGSVDSPLWRATRVTLVPDPFQYDPDDMVGISTPSDLRGGGSFELDYSQVQASKLSPMAPAVRVLAHRDRRTN
jgi:peptidase A4-like protein